MPFSSDQRSVSELVGDAVDQFSKLIRNEVAIARAEISAKATEAAIGVGFLVGAALLLIPALVLLLMALAAFLIEIGLSDSLANLIAGVVGLLISGILAYVGKSRLAPGNLKPNRTINELQRDVNAVKEHV
jgi:Putative Actinobacterial Holin-X, holin superfamily III